MLGHSGLSDPRANAVKSILLIVLPLVVACSGVSPQMDVAPPSLARSDIAHSTTSTDDAGLPEDDVPDDVPLPMPKPGAVERPNAAHPLDGVSDQELDRRVQEEPASLGSMSLGSPNNGALYNGIRLPKSELYVLNDPGNAWVTEETASYLQLAIEKVNRRFPETPKLYMGHGSAKKGGHLRPHLSHQSGRDVDVGFYYNGASRWYARASAKNLDRPRTWALVRALITETDVRVILLDYSVQRWLREYAESIGEDKKWLRAVFKGGAGRQAIIRYARGHRTHLHVRFYNPTAQETARRCYSRLAQLKLVRPLTRYISHRAKKGDTLSHLARRYGVKVRAIRRANGMRGTVLYARKTYRIPRRVDARPQAAVAVLPRLLPPTPSQP